MIRKNGFNKGFLIAALSLLGLFLSLTSHPLTTGHSSLAYTQDVADSHIFYLPHLNLGQDWQTTVSITNPECKCNHKWTNVTLTAYDKDDAPLGIVTSIKRLRAGKTKAVDTQTLPPGTESLKIESNGNLICNAIFKTTDGTKSEVVPAIKEPSRQLDFPTLDSYDDLYIYKTITLLNPNTTSASFDIIALDKDGYEIDRNVLPPLSSMESKTFSLVDIFGPRTLKDLSTVRVISDSNIMGLQLVDYPAVDLIGLSALTTTSKDWTFPIAIQGGNLELWTTVGIINPGENTASITIEAFDAGNNSLGIIDSRSIFPGATLLFSTANIIHGDIPLNADSLKVSSTQPVSGYEIIGIVDGNGLTAIMGIPEEDQTTVGFEITGTNDGGVLNVYSMVLMGDGSVKSTVLNLGSKEWRKSIKIIDIEPEETQTLTKSKESKGSYVVQATATSSQLSKPPFPVIFVHGLAGSADSWREFSDFLKDSGWHFGGSPTYNRSTNEVMDVAPGDFYTLNFSDNQQLHFDQQGFELSAIIKAVLDVNIGKTKVILIGHSMGGLASREYLQGLARFDENETSPRIPYRKDVAQLVTVGTPHNGAEITVIFTEVVGGPLLLKLMGIDPNSVAVHDLMPDSAAFNPTLPFGLNNLKNNSLPTDVLYASIIGYGTTVLGIKPPKDGDGIVTTDSQNLGNLAGTSEIMHQSIPIFIQQRCPCDIFYCGSLKNKPFLPHQTHKCEPSDTSVWEEILRQISRVSSITVTSPNGGETWQRGTTQTIRWTYTGSPGNYVKIELLKGTAVNSTITSSTSIGSNGSGSYSWTIPLTQTTGSDYKIRVTSTSNISYTDTSDSNFTISAQPPLLPDLTSSAVVASSYTSGQTGVQIPVTVYRSGGNLTQGTYVHAKLYWSTNSTWDTGDSVLWSSNDSIPDFPNSVLNSIGSKTVTATVNIPSVSQGTYYIISYADAPTSSYPKGYYSESNENNNTSAYSVSISPPTTLTVTYFKINNDASSTTTRTATLNNTATGSPTHYMASESSTFIGASWQTYSTAPSFTLSSGNGTKTVYFKVKNSASVESAVVNDSIMLEETPLPDLTSSATVASSYTSGQSGVQMPVTVYRSGGNLTQGTYVHAKLYWSTNSTWETGDSVLWSSNDSIPDFPNSVLNSNGSKTVTATIDIPSVSEGAYYIISYADAPTSSYLNGYYIESNENNNTSAYKVSISGNRPPVARLTMSAQGKTASENEILNLTVEQGQTVSVSFSAARSYDPDIDDYIAAYKWYINGSVVSTSRDFSSSLEAGTHQIYLEVWDNHGDQGAVGASIIITTSSITVSYQGHFAYTGWGNWVSNGVTCGTAGGNQMEAIKIITSNYGIQYRAHVAYDGWLPWVSNGAIAGTTGQGKSLQAIEIILLNAPSDLHVSYRVYVHGQGWHGWVSDGQQAGTTGQGLAVEAIEIKLQNW